MKTKAHIQYKNKNGIIVPGVTTILGILGKPQLIIWANRLGLKGIDSTKYTNEMAEIGALAHGMILADLKGEKFDTSDFSKNQIDKAENCYLQWLEWKGKRKLETICVETPLVSEKYQYGGTPDYFGLIDGVLTLGDYKTGGIWKEAYIQACAYRQLLIDNSYEPAKRIVILGIPRGEGERFQEIPYENFDVGWGIFERLIEVNKLLKELK